MRPEIPTELSQAALSDLPVAYPDESMHAAFGRMLRNDLSGLVVVDRRSPRQIVGNVSREDALAARRLRLEEDVIREGVLPLGRFHRAALAARQTESTATRGGHP